MRLSFVAERVLAVMAHPDDAEMLCAGTLARAKADGAAIGICIMCRGDKGLSSATAETRSPSQLAEARHIEAQGAADLLGAELFWFGAGDGELIDGLEQRRKLMEIYRQFKPTLVITHGAEDYHADHRAAHVIAEAVSWFCASRGHQTESGPMSAPPALWIADATDMSNFSPEFYIDVSAFAKLKHAMLACHKSQLIRGGDDDFAALDRLMAHQFATRGIQSRVAAAEAFRQHHAFKRVAAW